ncbi:hypothetical protein QQF64_014860 [Cirrhinus molitorella]|uniref:Uncharacterized protein n=1 Tax=Cirrhinus molitorella TaxID=172907 RepID=A0ABR3NTA8_9TELE
MRGKEITDTFGEWPRYLLFCVWVIDITLIFLVHHLETRLKKIVENYHRDRCQQEDYVNCTTLHASKPAEAVIEQLM